MAASEELTSFDAFSEHVQSKIASKLTTSDLARIRAVAKSWKAIADNTAVRQASFRRTWGLLGLDGEPVQSNFYLSAGLGHFVVKVKVEQKTTIASLLVKFKTDSVSLRVLNNCSSDFSLQCRPHVYVPVMNRSQLLDRRVTFVYDRFCSRQLVVLQSLPAGSSVPESPSLPADSTVAGTIESLHRGASTARAAQETEWRLEEGELEGYRKETLLKKLSRHMGKGLSIDEGTASYYLGLANGDIKRAFITYKEDLAWETENPKGFLPLRERVPIPE